MIIRSSRGIVFSNENISLKSIERCSPTTGTVVDKTTGIKYIIKRWQTTGVVPSQLVRQPLPNKDGLYPFETVTDLSDIPTKHEDRFRRLQEDAQRDLNAMREKMKKPKTVEKQSEDVKDNIKEE